MVLRRSSLLSLTAYCFSLNLHNNPRLTRYDLRIMGKRDHCNDEMNICCADNMPKSQNLYVNKYNDSSC